MEYSRRPTKSIPKENQLKILNKIYQTYLVSTTVPLPFISTIDLLAHPVNLHQVICHNTSFTIGQHWFRRWPMLTWNVFSILSPTVSQWVKNIFCHRHNSIKYNVICVIWTLPSFRRFWFNTKATCVWFFAGLRTLRRKESKYRESKIV